MRFSPEFLDRLRSQVVLSQVVGRRVVLKRHGREHMGLCPFHKEKSPSFTVNDDKGFYHCFGCSAHGDAIRFLTDHEGLPYPEAVERLAGEFGIPLPQMTQEQVQVAKRYGSLQDVMEAACQWFEAQLKAPSGKVAQDYLKGRGLTGKTAKHFRMGFSPAGRDALKTHLLSKGITDNQLVEVGLAIRPDRGGASYDRFRARVMFPITDRRGKVIAFGGRVIPSLVDETNREAPKYLNSPETPLFKKGEVLYAYEHARQMAHKTGTLLVTEGYMDVIALHQQGFANAVAPLGTAVTENHLRLMWQIVDEPILCLDGDAAGQRAMHRAAELCLPLLKPGKSLRFLVLPKGEDPDTIVRKEGAEAFSARLEMAIPLSDALWEHYAADLRANATPEKKAALEHILNTLCERIADPVVKAHFKDFFKKRVWPERKFTPKGAKKKQNSSELNQIRSRDVEAFMKTGTIAQIRKREQALLELVFCHPSLIHLGEVEEALGSFTFTDVSSDAIRQLIMDVLVIDHDLSRAEVERMAAERGVLQQVTGLYGKGNSDETPNELYALTRWRLEVNAHSLVRMEAERKLLETAMAEHMDEENYERLIAIIRQIGELQEQSAELQRQLDRSAN